MCAEQRGIFMKNRAEHISAQSKWCASFLRKIRKEFYSMQSKAWYGYLLRTVDPAFCADVPRRRSKPDSVLADEARAALAGFLSNFTHLNLPAGTELGVDGEFRGLGGVVYLTVRLPGKDPIPVCEIPHDPSCAESIWEKEVLSWVSSQFHLCWHDGYSQCNILLGDAVKVENDIRRMEFSNGFTAAVEELPDDMKNAYLSTDFSPKVEIVDGAPQVTFHIFSPFGGIFRRMACAEVPEDEKAVFPYACGVCY